MKKLKQFMERNKITKKFWLGLAAYFFGILLWEAFLLWIFMSIIPAK